MASFFASVRRAADACMRAYIYDCAVHAVPVCQLCTFWKSRPGIAEPPGRVIDCHDHHGACGSGLVFFSFAPPLSLSLQLILQFSDQGQECKD